MRPLRELLDMVVERNGTDLHIKAGAPPMLRIAGHLERVENEPDIATEETEQLLETLLTDSQRQNFRQSQELDFSHPISVEHRFRVNAYYHLGTVAFAFRLLRRDMLSFEGLMLPEVVKNLAGRYNGLILVTGITGSGKSTTMATMVEHINQTRRCHIVTIEDPVEFTYSDAKSIVSQREVGMDTKGFNEALRRALRQDPDVILIGEMRDVETIRTAISAAETGHLVLSTLHTVQAAPTIDRILSFFPGVEQPQVRTQLSECLAGIISQRLVPRSDKEGLVPLLEILVNNPTVRKLIYEGKTGALNQIIQNREEGMQTFNQALFDLVKKNIVSKETAQYASPNWTELKRNLEGGFSGGDRAAILGI